jgi:hypothetical protein
MVRAILYYIQKRLKSMGKDNASIRFLFCCVQCCLKCLQVSNVCTYVRPYSCVCTLGYPILLCRRVWR